MDDTPSGLVLFGIAFGVISSFVLLLWGVNAIKGWLSHDMSTSPTPRPVPADRANRSIDQSTPTSLDRQTSAQIERGLAAAPAEPKHDIPDMDAADGGMGWEMPRMSLYPSRAEIITWMAAIKGHDGKHHFSANDIVKLVKGDRTEVLAIVRQVREPLPEFRPLTSEQQATREQLELPRR
jgi:hypothetical protein